METGATSGGQRFGHEVLVVAGLVGAIIACWLLLVPQGAQPDEHSHLVRSAALVRGADPVEGASGEYELPDRYLMPDPGCYAFHPTEAASCAPPSDPRRDSASGSLVLLTRATDYPPGAHVVFGLAGWLPGLDPVWWARSAAAAVATALVAAGLVVARRSSTLAAGALLLGMTPMAWSILPAVNPSSFVIAGAVALWVGLLHGWRRGELPTGASWLVASGWAALAVSRRDGLVWACLITATVLALRDVTLRELARRLGRVPLGVIGVSTVIVLVWGIRSSSSTSRWVVAAPFALIGFEAGRAWWRSRTRRPITTVAVLGGGAVVAVAAWVALVSTRDGGWNTDLTIAIVNQTDENLVEAIGVLGWLDTPVPWFVVFVWLMSIGGLVALGVANRSRGLAAAGALAGLAAVTAWTFELLQGDETGFYWQGRYSLPLLIGIPLCLAYRSDRLTGPAASDRSMVHLTRVVAIWITVVGLASLDVAAWAAARRWGVGTLGTYRPWDWDTPIQPVQPLVLLVVLAGATAGLAVVVLRRSGQHR